MTIEPLKLRYRKPTFKLIFDDKRLQITVKGKGPQRNQNLTKITLLYSREDYGSVKEKLQAFDKETNISKKLHHLADALNIGSDSINLDELCFLFQILWHYPWEC